MAFKEFLKLYRFELILLIVILAASLLSYFFGPRFGLLANREQFQQYVSSFGVWGPVIMILLTLVEVAVAPIPGALPPVAAGFLFGKFWGAIYVVIGNILGANLLFWLARRFGIKIFSWFINRGQLAKFSAMIESRQKFLWLTYFIPVFPLDVITIALGLSRIKHNTFLILTSLGLAVSMTILTVFGDSLFSLVFR